MKIKAPRLRDTSRLARAHFAAPLARLGPRPRPAAEPLRRALRTTLLGRVPSEERAWGARIEAWRQRLSTDRAPTGLPAFDPVREGPDGRSGDDQGPATVGSASALMSLPELWCVLLMRLVRELAPRRCLELGTGFGISTAYQAAALELNGSGGMTTLEGSPTWARLAQRGLEALALQDVEIRVGPIAEELPAALEQAGPPDFVLIDAEHEEEATLGHFEALLPHLSDGAMIVLDDVDWSGIGRAHALIGDHERVSTSLRIGRLGVSIIDGQGSASP